MKFISLSAVLALSVCILGMRCEDIASSDVQELTVDTVDSAEFDIATIEEEVTEESVSESNVHEEQPTWGQWFKGLIWGGETSVASEGTEAEGILAEDDHCCGDDAEEHFDESTDADHETSVEKKRNVKKIVVITIIVVVVALALVALLVLYFTKRGESAKNPSKPLVSA